MAVQLLLKTKKSVISYFFSLEALPQQEDQGPESKRRTGIENDIKLYYKVLRTENNVNIPPKTPTETFLNIKL